MKNILNYLKWIKRILINIRTFIIVVLLIFIISAAVYFLLFPSSGALVWFIISLLATIAYERITKRYIKDQYKKGLKALEDARETDDPKSSISKYDSAVDNFMSISNHRMQAIALREKSEVYDELVDSESSEKYAKEAIHQFEKAIKTISDPWEIAQCALAKAQLMQQFDGENLDDIIREYRRSIDHFKQGSYSWEGAVAYRELGKIFRDADQLKGAIIQLENAAKEFNKGMNYWESAVIYRELYNMVLQDNEDEAIEYLIKAAEQHRSGFAYWEAATNYKEIGEFFKEEDKEKAIEYLELAKQSYLQAGEEEEAKEIEKEIKTLIKAKN